MKERGQIEQYSITFLKLHVFRSIKHGRVFWYLTDSDLSSVRSCTPEQCTLDKTLFPKYQKKHGLTGHPVKVEKVEEGTASEDRLKVKFGHLSLSSDTLP